MAMELIWPIIYPSLVGVACLAYVGWCVLRARPDLDSGPPGPEKHDPRRWRRNPRPRPPRRGPHTSGAQRSEGRTAVTRR